RRIGWAKILKRQCCLPISARRRWKRWTSCWTSCAHHWNKNATPCRSERRSRTESISCGSRAALAYRRYTNSRLLHAGGLGQRGQAPPPAQQQQAGGQFVKAILRQGGAQIVELFVAQADAVQRIAPGQCAP